MINHRCVKAGVFGFVLAFSCMAFAQAPEIDPATIGVSGSDIQIVTLILQYFGLPGVIGYALYRGANAISSLSSWSPTITIRIVRHDEDQPPKTQEVPK